MCIQGRGVEGREKASLLGRCGSNRSTASFASWVVVPVVRCEETQAVSHLMLAEGLDGRFLLLLRVGARHRHAQVVLGVDTFGGLRMDLGGLKAALRAAGFGRPVEDALCAAG